MLDQIICGDSREVLKQIADDSVDLVACDPPYAWNFMGLDFDKALPDPAIWRECVRVLKPGGLAFAMCGTRGDCLWRMLRDLEESGFDVGLSTLQWIYHSGFPKALDIGKDFDKAAFTGWVADKYTKIVCPFAHKHKDFTKRKVDCPECKRITWAFCEGYMDELTLAHVRKATSAAVNGQLADLRNGPNTKPETKGRSAHHTDRAAGILATEGRAMRTDAGAELLTALLARFWEPLAKSERLFAWREHSENPDLSLPPGVRVKVGEKAMGYPDGNQWGKVTKRERPSVVTGEEGSGEVIESQSVTAPSVDLAKEWDGWKAQSGIKPSFEFIIMARKPMAKSPVRENVAEYGCGAINVDAARVPFGQEVLDQRWVDNNLEREQRDRTSLNTYSGGRFSSEFSAQGRFPANTICQDGILGEASRYYDLDRWSQENGFDEDWTWLAQHGLLMVPKPSKSEKEAGCEEFEKKPSQSAVSMPLVTRQNWGSPHEKIQQRKTELRNDHSTVKPVRLFGWLIALGCPEGGVMLDPFVGSGTSCVAAIQQRKHYIGIDTGRHYCDIAEARCEHARQGREQGQLL